MKTMFIISILHFSIASVKLSELPLILCPNTDSSMIELKQVTMDPWPPIKGRSSVVEFKGTAKTDIHQTNGRIDAYLGGTRFFSTAIGGSYSTGRGQAYDYSFSYSIPSYVPPGNYETRISFISEDHTSYTCVVINLHF